MDILLIMGISIFNIKKVSKIFLKKFLTISLFYNFLFVTLLCSFVSWYFHCFVYIMDYFPLYFYLTFSKIG